MSNWTSSFGQAQAYPELKIDVRQIGLRGRSGPSTKDWRQYSCAVTGRSFDNFEIVLSRGQAFRDWLWQRMLISFATAAVLILALGSMIRIATGVMVREIEVAFKLHFGISDNAVKQSGISRFLGGAISRLGPLRDAKSTIDDLGSRLRKEVMNSSALEVSLGRRRLFSKYIHDIRSPISALKIVFQKRKSSFSEEESSIIKLTIQRLEELATGVLTTEKSAIQHSLAASEGLSIDDLVPLFEIVTQRFSLTLGAACTVSLRAEGLAENGKKFEISAAEMDRLITNLVNNGKEAGATEVDLALIIDGSNVMVIYKDNGKGGLGDDLRPKRSVAEARTVTGYGLGLEIVTEIIKKGQGHVLVDSPAGVGTTITLRFALR